MFCAYITNTKILKVRRYFFIGKETREKNAALFR